MSENERREALADFLRKRRAHLSPADVGLPAGLRRRTPGLRREEVAQLANIGTSWYVWLEQGRDVHPSAQVLESLAEALRLTPNERRHLFLLAGQAFPPATSSIEETLQPVLQRMVDEFGPIPAYASGRRWDYLAWNDAADKIFNIAQPTPPYAYNVLWRLFSAPPERHSAHWEKIGRGILAEFRTASARYPGDSSFDELIEDLKRVSPDFRLWWPQHEARSTLYGHKSLMHPIIGDLEFEQMTLQVINEPDVRIVIYTPEAETRAKIQSYLLQQGAADNQAVLT
ncbi:MAG TPA: helix-turn-helix transcriptional regulator [Ktedonobacteraceae bacterium]